MVTGHPNGWPLYPEDEMILRGEVGERAWSHAQDCNPYEYNTLDEIRDYIPGIVDYWEGE